MYIGIVLQLESYDLLFSVSVTVGVEQLVECTTSNHNYIKLLTHVTKSWTPEN